MTYPAEQLQRGLFALITGDAGLHAAMGGAARAYDRVPKDHVFPYVTIPDGQFTDDADTCELNRYEAFVDLQVWSRAVGNVEAKRISGALRAALYGGSLSMDGWSTPVIQVTSINHFRDPDGLTERARVSVRFIIEPA